MGHVPTQARKSWINTIKSHSVPFIVCPQTLYGRINPDKKTELSENETIIKCTTIDDLVIDLKLSRLDFIKMDIEGHELNAVKGMKNLLTRNKCILQVEVFEDNVTTFESYINGIGYQKRQQFDADKIFSNY